MNAGTDAPSAPPWRQCPTPASTPKSRTPSTRKMLPATWQRTNPANPANECRGDGRPLRPCPRGNAQSPLRRTPSTRKMLPATWQRTKPTNPANERGGTGTPPSAPPWRKCSKPAAPDATPASTPKSRMPSTRKMLPETWQRTNPTNPANECGGADAPFGPALTEMLKARCAGRLQHGRCSRRHGSGRILRTGGMNAGGTDAPFGPALTEMLEAHYAGRLQHGRCSRRHAADESYESGE